MEVMPGEAKVWRMRYRLAGKQEKIILGDYPIYILVKAISLHVVCKAPGRRDLSPMCRSGSTRSPMMPNLQQRSWCTCSSVNGV